jgi:branched-chain amino acid transport system substrate-binding protein
VRKASGWLVTTLTLAALAACSLGGGTPSQTLRIGVDLPLGGPESRAGVPALDGVRLYVQQHPTIGGFAVELVIKDDTSGGVAEPPLGATNVEAFVSDPSVMGVIGPLDSSLARAEIPVANQGSLAMISPGASSPCLTLNDYLPAGLNTPHVPVSCKAAGLPSASDLRPAGVNNFFRLAAPDDLQGPAAAEYAYRKLHLLRVATISDGEGYGQALAAGFATRFRALGGSIVGRLDVTAGSDAGAFLKHAKADGGQAIYYGGLSAGCTIRAQMAAIFDPGEAAPMLGGEAIAQDPACLTAAGSNAAGIFATVSVTDASAIGTAEPVLRDFRAAYPNPQDLGLYTVVAYDATGLLYAAIDRAIRAAGGGLPPRGNVISQLSLAHGYPGATGILGFDPNGDSTKRALSVLESAAGDPQGTWQPAGDVDFSAALPY